jgi:hypothetical protein
LQIGGKGYSSLADMRSHAEGVDGVLRVSSAPGEGTVIGGWVAVDEALSENVHSDNELVDV